MATTQHHTIVIIGSGPAGITAAYYLGRSYKMAPLVIEGNPGGTLMSVSKIENWPCYESISGVELMQQMTKQAKKAGAIFLSDIVTNINLNNRPFTINLISGNTITAEALIVATGMTPKKVGCPGEDVYRRKGICNCALCDGPLFMNQQVVVVGGGGMALQNTKLLTKYAKKITIINKAPELSGPEALINELKQHQKVTILNNCSLTSIAGNGEKVTAITYQDEQKNNHELPTDGVFISIGYEPNTELFKNKLTINNVGKIEISPLGHTSITGVFGAGTATTIAHDQAIVCAASGCVAAIEAGNFIGRTPAKNFTYRGSIMI
jgi:thioredoxin reductase (NADPH)